MDKTIKVILIGAGGRGNTYTDMMKEANGKFEVVGVAEPIADRRNHIKEKWGLSDDVCFEDYKPLLALPKFADVAVIATMDRMHTEPAMMAIEKKYDLLLEKPVAPTPEECLQIEKCAKENNVKVLICHVLRYTDFYKRLKQIIDDGLIGEVVSVDAMECVGNVHQSHSFVRGNWGNSDESSPMILQKSCHDMDILQWLIGKKCTRVSSFGSLTYFTEKNAPADSPEYCIDGCPHGETCPYNAVKLYFDDKDNAWFRCASSKKTYPTDEDITEVLKNTQYGKCVFKCNNNVVDHQVVNLEFDGGAVVSFNMNAFNTGGRTIRLMGTKGEVKACFGEPTLDYYNFETKEHTELKIADEAVDDSIVGGHGGGDDGIIDALYKYIVDGVTDKSTSEIDISVDNHMIAFAAEEARISGKVIVPDELKKNAMAAL